MKREYDEVLSEYCTSFYDETPSIHLPDLLLNTGCFAKSKGEYLVIIGLYLMAGCKIWPWHEGYKDPNEGEDKTLYVLRDVGFLKEIYAIPHDIKLLTLNELFYIVTGKLH